MFKLTTAEMKVVAFLVGVLLLGVAVKQWRAQRRQPAQSAPSSAE